jgi:methionine-rich copper-binding protein CopC
VFGTLTLNNSLFNGNIATFGGAIHNQDTLTLNNCTFSNNTALFGGAIYNIYSSLTVTSSIFQNNGAYDGGAICNYDVILNVTGSTIKNNTALYEGSAIYNDGTAGIGNAVVEFNRIVGNINSNSEIYSTDNLINADLNWWGSNKNPSSYVNSNINITSWLVLTIKATQSTIPNNSHSIITADLLHTNNGTLVSSSIPDGVPVTFKTNLGTINSASTIMDGSAQSKLTSGVTAGIATISATVDNQLVTTNVIIKDTIPPTVTATTPKNGATGISKTATITIKFSENIKTSTYFNNITIKNQTTGRYITISKIMKGNTLTIKTSEKSANTWYTVTIPKSAIKDLAGNNLTANYIFKFKTGT